MLGFCAGFYAGFYAVLYERGRLWERAAQVGSGMGWDGMGWDGISVGIGPDEGMGRMGDGSTCQEAVVPA